MRIIERASKRKESFNWRRIADVLGIKPPSCVSAMNTVANTITFMLFDERHKLVVRTVEGTGKGIVAFGEVSDRDLEPFRFEVPPRIENDRVIFECRDPRLERDVLVLFTQKTGLVGEKRY